MLHGIVILVLLYLSVQDIRHQKLVPAVYPILFATVLLRVIFCGAKWSTAVLGILGTFLVLFLVYWMTRGNGIGGGDVKLLTILGGYFGFWGAMLTIFFGGSYACIAFILRRSNRKKRKKIALVPYLAAGVLTELLVGKYILSFV